MSTLTSPARPQLVRSGLTKLITLRSIWITAVATCAVVVLVGWSQAGAVGRAIAANDPELAPGAAPETVGFDWVALGAIGVIVIGVMAAGSEYVSGQVKTSLIATPARWQLFGTQVGALLILVTVLGSVTVPALSLLSQASIGDLAVIRGGVPASLGWRWVGAIVFWDALALIGFALGTLLRQALIPLFVLLIVSQLSLLLLLLSTRFAYLPTVAGVQLFDPGLVVGSYPAAALTAPAAAAVTAGWVVVLVGLAGWRFSRRDTLG